MWEWKSSVAGAVGALPDPHFWASVPIPHLLANFSRGQPLA